MAKKIKLYDVGLNKVLDLLYLSSTGYIQLRNNASTKEIKTLLTNVANRREQLAQEIEDVMVENGIQIDKRTWSSSVRAFPPRSKEVDAKSQFETIDKELLDEYGQVVTFSEATDELVDLFDDHRSNIQADLKEVSSKLSS